MSNDIEKFDPSKLMDGVRDRIKATFVSLIPDDQWQKLVESEINKFFANTDNYNDKRSPFRKIVDEELTKLAKEKISEGLKAYTNETWNNNQLVISDLLREHLINNSSQIFASAFSSMFQQVVNSLPRSY